MIELEELVTLSKELKLSGLKNNLVKYLDDAEKNKETYREFLYKVLKSEIDKRAQDAENKRIKKARFLYLKNIDTFDLTFQTSIDLQKIKILKELKWVDDAYNLIFLGPPGVGKTHLLIGIREYAARNGYHILFVNMEGLIYYLKNRDHDRKSKKIYNQILKCDLLLIDEVGYLPLNKEEANLFFSIISALHEQTSIAITSNKDFSDWTELLQDEAIATAILDRLIYRCQIFNLKGKSYRMEKRETLFK